MNGLTLVDKAKYAVIKTLARNYLNKAQETGPDTPEGMEFYKTAIHLYSAAIEINNVTSSHYANRGVARAKLNLLTDAVNDFTFAIRLDPENIQLYTNRSIAYAKMGHKELVKLDQSKIRKLQEEQKEKEQKENEILAQMMFIQSSNNPNIPW